MKMLYPAMVYRSPGTHQGPGGTYDYQQVKDESELLKSFDAGWFPSVWHAIDEADFDVDDYLDDVIPEDPPTREELEIKAAELGIKFRSSISDEKLLERINSHYQGGE